MFNLLALTLLSACADSPAAMPPVGTTMRYTGEMTARVGASLSPESGRFSQIGFRDDKRDFLLLDKMHGGIIIFNDGTAAFSDAALTGENRSDFLASDAIGKTFGEQKGLARKVTSAGRYTVSIGNDHHYGAVLASNEMRGADRNIAIHDASAGAPAEYRDAMPRSPRDIDKHITQGRVGVDGPTMKRLPAHLANNAAMPLSVLPEDRICQRTEI